MSRILKTYEFYVIIIFILLSRLGHAQTGFTLDLISIKDGLSNNVLWGVWQDHDGFLWIATEDGLLKYKSDKTPEEIVNTLKEQG